MGRTNNTNGRARPQKLYGDSDDERLDLKIDSIKEKQSTPCFVYSLTFFASLGGFLFGYDTSVISGSMILLRNEFGLSSFWQELLVSITIATAAVFALVGGFLNDKLGRRPVILSASLLFTAGAICMGAAIDKYMLLAGRVVVGTAIGMMSSTIPIYLAECSPAHIRGRLVSTNIAMVTCGQCVAGFIDGLFSTDQKHGWRYMLGLAGIPSLIQMLGFIFLPESPRWLILSSQDEKARRVLQSIRGQLDIEDEYKSIKTSCVEARREEEESKLPVLLHMLQHPSLRRALAVGCTLQAVQQLAGINTVMYYSATIIKMSGVRSDQTAIWLAAVVASINFLFTLLGLYLVEKIGRRLLTLGSLVGSICCLVLLAVGFYIASLNTPVVTMVEKLPPNSSSCASHSLCNDCMLDPSCGFCFTQDHGSHISNSSCLPVSGDNPWHASSGRCKSPSVPNTHTYWAYDFCPSSLSWLPLIGLILYIMCFAPGMGPMPWTINSELYPFHARSSAMSVATFVNWSCNLAVSMSFLTLTETLSRLGTFLLYAGLAAIGAVMLYFWLPETRGKSLEEVEGLFAKPWCGAASSMDYNIKTIQYVHIRGLNRDGRESELDSPE